MLQVSNLKKSYSTRVLFENLTFSVDKGSVVGLVGRNGCGKSTLFKIILGQEEAEEGKITMPSGYKIGFLDQHISFSKPTLIEECVQMLREDSFRSGFHPRGPGKISGYFFRRLSASDQSLQMPVDSAGSYFAG